MNETKLEMALASPVKPSPGNWVRFKQGLRTLYEDPNSTPDQGLAEQVRHTLGTDDLLRKNDLMHMRVTLNMGVATLTGHVVRSRSKARAEELAGETPGVLQVVNHLVVDEELMITVAQALSHDPRTQSEQFQVNVQHGVIYLGGTVQDAAVRSASAVVAAAIPQGRGIINLLKAPGSVLDKDEERFIQPQVESAIYATDGPVGRVQQVIINPHNRRVTAVVVDVPSAAPPEPMYEQLPTAPTPRHRLIPLLYLRLVPSGALFLNVNSVATAGFAAFDPLHFAAPPPDWQPPYPYGWADVQFYLAR